MIGDCVEYMSEGGIKFRSDSEVREFETSITSSKLRFEFENFEFENDVRRIYPRVDPYEVTVEPPDVIVVRK
jgi:hypothetical protein